MSASANRQIAVFERDRGLPSGEVAHAFRRWNATTRRPRGKADPFYERNDTALRSDDHHVRTLLEVALHALHRKARRELSTVVGPADERVLRRTLNNPFADPGLPWWTRRIGA
ncbi:hypothetical protein ABZ318_35775 [Streptomyces sp. NPDC006197]|uniref:hypothetical protein n=1 Tax=Streptomyces sp. NPDC006197 TaxID=3156685 RepID=UPI0033BBB0F9